MHDPRTIPDRVHIVGAGGAGMSGLAKILSRLGHTVSGSDLKPGRMFDVLPDVGVETWVGHRPDAMAGVGVVVRSSAVPDTDPELRAAASAGVPVWGRPALLAELTAANRTIGFAGTHGKTTSTAMAVTALRGIDLDPSFLVGGQLVDLNTGAHVGGEPFILEADEAFGTFRHLRLSGVVVTNIEPDHLDYYGSVAALEDAFAQVVDRVDGPRVVCVDDAGVRRLAHRSDVTTFGRSDAAEWQIADLSHGGRGVSFTLRGPGVETTLTLPKPGSHIAADAAGVLVLLHHLGYDIEAMGRALGGFSGVKRRYEVRAVVGDVTVVDDYAHHPTEVAATIEAASLGATGRVVVVFQPHRYSRTADLGPEFGTPLAHADHVIVTDVYPAGEQPVIGVTGRLVAQAVEAAGGSVSYVRLLPDVPAAVASAVEPGDTLLLLGAGDITLLAGPIAQAIGGTT